MGGAPTKSRPFRVVYLAPPAHEAGRLSRYGFLDEEIRALASRGVEAFVLSFVSRDSDDGRIHVRHIPADSWRERARAGGFVWPFLRQSSVPSWSGLQRQYRAVRAERIAARVVAEERADLIHSFFGWPGGWGGMMVKQATGVPLVAGLRGSDVNTFPAVGYGSRLDPAFDRTFRRLLRAADATVSNSQFTRRQALSLGAIAEKAAVVHKGVKLDVFEGKCRDGGTAGLADRRRPVVLAVGGLVPIKGLVHVIDALAILRAQGTDFSFVVCGDGPEHPALTKHAATAGLSGQTTFLGKVSRADIPGVFAAADVLVHGSLMEAAGNVLLEAMAARLPVVCTDAGGPSEYVRDEVTGFVVPVADPKAMAERVGWLLRNHDARESMGRLGRERVEQFFTYDDMISKTMEIYERVLLPAGPSSGAVAASTSMSSAEMEAEASW